MRLILVHPKPLCERGLCYGRLDLDSDEDALKAAAHRLEGIPGSCRIVTSPARRAHRLAAMLCAGPEIEPRLQELDFGDWEGRHWADLGQTAIEAWRRGLPHSAPPNGETLTAMARRCASWLSTLDADGPPILAITHAGPIRVLRALLSGEPLLAYFGESVPFAEPFMLELSAGLEVKFSHSMPGS